MSTAIAKIRWNSCWRIVPNQISASKLLNSISSPSDIDAVIKLEAMTGLKFIDNVEAINSASSNKKKNSAEFAIVDAITSFLNPLGGRFTDGSYGVIHIFKTLETAISETKTNFESFLNGIQIEKFNMKMDAYALDIKGSFHDIRGQAEKLPYIYLEDDNEYSSAFAKNLWKSGSEGIIFDSFANRTECIAVFNSASIASVRMEKELSFTWNGKKFSRP